MPEQYDTDLRNRLAQITQMGTNANVFASQAATLRQQQQAAQDAARQQALMAKAAQAQQQAYQQQNAPAAPPVTPNLALPAAAKGNNFGNFLRAISGQESGGNYKAVNKDSGALGKYQIMPGNVPSWSKSALGRSITPQQFLNSPQLQEQVAQAKLKEYYDKYGPDGAAVAWYAGEGTARGYKRNPSRYTAPQGNYPSISSYALSILRKMGLR